METYIEVTTTTEKLEDAQKIARAIVEKRLGACAQLLGPIQSIYWWKGKIETAQEWLCLMKSKKSLYSELEKTIKALHPYETPEIIVKPIIDGSADYLEWLQHEIKQ